MSITDELRELAKTFAHWWYDPVKGECTYTTGTMPPSIDAIRLDSNIIAIADRIDAEYQKAIRELNNLADASLLLPVDADGVPICVGDVMEWIDLDGEVTVTCSVDAVGVDCFFAWDKGNRRYAQKCANAYRHHHAPTVEDVLREFALKVAGEECMTMRTDVVEEYAEKLREVLGE